MKKKKKVSKVVIRPNIESIDGKYRLYMVKHDDKLVPILDINGDVWDGNGFITDNLYNTLDQYLNYKKVTDDFVGIIEEIPLTDFELIFEILNKGKELGFFK